MVVCLWANLFKAWAGLQKAQFLVISRFMNSYQNKFSFHQTSKGAVKTLIYLIYSNLPPKNIYQLGIVAVSLWEILLKACWAAKGPISIVRKVKDSMTKGPTVSRWIYISWIEKIWNVSQCIAMCDNLTCVLLLIFSFYPFHFFQYQN